MSVLGVNPLLLGSGDAAAGFTTQRSVRLRSSASANFSRTQTTTTNSLKWTYSTWVKRGSLASFSFLLQGYVNGTNRTPILFSSTDNLNMYYVSGGSVIWQVVTNAVFRDPSAWYHIVVAFDSTDATSSNRLKMYVNGVQQTFSSATYPSLNQATQINASGNAQYLGVETSTPYYFDGYLTEVNFIDGQALTPSSFGEYDAVRNTQWKPKRYTGTYGTNGFYLNFSDNSNNTAATIGKDSSGNSNNWTPNGIIVTAGIAYDSMTDVPTLTSETASNFATLNPVDTGGGSVTLSGGNLNYSIASGAGSQVRGTIGADLSSKWYWEYTNGTTATALNPVMFGISTVDGQITNNSTSLKLAAIIYTDGVTNYLASKYINGAGTSVTTQFRSAAIGDIFQIAYDAATGNLWFGKNNTWYDATNGTTGNPSTGANPVFTLPTGSSMTPFLANLGATYTGSLNCGQRPFVQPVPTGFKSLNTYNLPDGNVTSSDDYHKIYSYTGNGGGLQVGEVQKPMSLFNLDRSLRFRSSASPYLSRTPASAGSQTTWTWSGWVKRGALGVRQFITMSGINPNPTQVWQVEFDASDKLNFYNQTINTYRLSTRVFRDTSNWYHIVFCADTNNATAQNRFRCWVNGVEITAWDTNSVISSGYTFAYNGAYLHGIGAYTYSGNGLPLDGYLADVYFIDGQALDPTSFGTYDGNYYWTPKAYTGTYGTNGFHLEFEDNSAATAAAIGKDTSGNVNNWTPSGISVTAGATYDSMTDVPTQTSTDVANFSTLNPLTKNGAGTTISNGNLTSTKSTSNSAEFLHSTIGVQNSGSYYWEITPTTITNNGLYIGLGDGASSSPKRMFWWSNGNVYNNVGTVVSAGGSYVANDVLGFAYNVSSDTLSLYKNNTLTHTITNVLTNLGITSGTSVFAYILGDGANNGYVLNANFGQRPFTYTPPTGFRSINSFNIAEVLGDVESPDFVWIKSRSASGDHALFNSVVGTGKYLRSSNSGGEVTDVNSLIQFNKNGFLLGNAAIVNTSATTYVASAWKSGNTTVTNTDGRQTITITVASPAVVTATGHSFNNGDIIQLYTTGALPTGLSTNVNYYIVNKATNTFQLSLTNGGSAINTSGTQSGTHSCTFYSQVRANQTAGFSIVTYTGTGVNTTVGHGLGVAPKMIIIKSKTVVQDWAVYHSNLTSAIYWLQLNGTGTQNNNAAVWNSTAPTSSVFSVGTASVSNATSGLVAYCFADVNGFSKFGSYISNNDPNGPFVYTGFRPRWLMVKRAIVTSGTGGWFMYDAERNSYNVMDKYIFAEGTAGDNILAVFDFTSNGFKIRSNNVHVNTTAGDTYIYMAFAEHPFKYALAR
jgi:hypothetical protein